jgi:hypothetical protein
MDRHRRAAQLLGTCLFKIDKAAGYPATQIISARTRETPKDSLKKDYLQASTRSGNY